MFKHSLIRKHVALFWIACSYTQVSHKRTLQIASWVVWIDKEVIPALLVSYFFLFASKRQTEQSVSPYFLFLYQENMSGQRRAAVCLSIAKKDRKRYPFVWEEEPVNKNAYYSNKSTQFSFAPSHSMFLLLWHTNTDIQFCAWGQAKKPGQTIPGGHCVPEAWLKDERRERISRRSVYCLTTVCVFI